MTFERAGCIQRIRTRRESCPRGTAIALPRKRTTFSPPVTDEQAYADVNHETFHCVHGARESTIRNEVEAWRLARQHSLRWTPAMQANMKRALGTYLLSAEACELIDVAEAERFCSDLEFRRERTRRALLEAQR